MDDEFDEWQEAEIIQTAIPTVGFSAPQQEADGESASNYPQLSIENVHASNQPQIIHAVNQQIQNTIDSKLPQAVEFPELQVPVDGFNIFINSGIDMSSNYTSLKMLQTDDTSHPFKQSEQSKSQPLFHVDLLVQQSIHPSSKKKQAGTQDKLQANSQQRAQQTASFRPTAAQSQMPNVHHNQNTTSQDRKVEQQSEQEQWEWEQAVPSISQPPSNQLMTQKQDDHIVTYPQNEDVHTESIQTVQPTNSGFELQTKMPEPSNLEAHTHTVSAVGDDYDEFGEYEEQTVSEIKGPAHVDPAPPISEQVLLKISVFLNGLPNYSFIRANHFITS